MASELEESSQSSQPSPRSSSRSTPRRYRWNKIMFKIICFCAVVLVLVLISVNVYLDRTREAYTLSRGNRWEMLGRRHGRTIKSSVKSFPSPTSSSGRIVNALDDVASQEASVGVHQHRSTTAAFKGMGVTYRKGSRPMNELVVAHITEETTRGELRMYLRTLHRSGVTARADIVFLFPGNPNDEVVKSVIEEEERSFWTLMVEAQATAPPHNKKSSSTSLNQTSAGVIDPKRIFFSPNSSICPFNMAAFWHSRFDGMRNKGRRRRIIWATDNLHATGTTREEMAKAVDWGDWGSIVGFDMQDFEVDDALLGFLDDPPAQLRRWMCYNMLLGMLKSKYKTVLLTEIGEVIILGDVLLAMRHTPVHSEIHLFNEDRSWNAVTVDVKNRSVQNDLLQQSDKKVFGTAGIGMHLKSTAMKEIYGTEMIWADYKLKTVLGSGIIMASMKPIISLSNAMLTEIVRVASTIQKSRQPFPDKPLLNYLVMKSGILDRKVIENLVMIPNGMSLVHSLPGSLQKSVFFREQGDAFHALQGLNDGQVAQDIVTMIVRRVSASICSSPQGFPLVYKDCFHGTTAN